jgi:hypothetical protein
MRPPGLLIGNPGGRPPQLHRPAFRAFWFLMGGSTGRDRESLFVECLELPAVSEVKKAGAAAQIWTFVLPSLSASSLKLNTTWRCGSTSPTNGGSRGVWLGDSGIGHFFAKSAQPHFAWPSPGVSLSMANCYIRGFRMASAILVGLRGARPGRSVPASTRDGSHDVSTAHRQDYRKH